MILEDDQAPTFSGFSDLSPASVVYGKHISLYNSSRHQTPKNVSSRHLLRNGFQIRFYSFEQPQCDFISTLFNSVFDTLQLTPSFNRDGRCHSLAAILERVWICDVPTFETYPLTFCKLRKVSFICKLESFSSTSRCSSLTRRSSDATPT